MKKVETLRFKAEFASEVMKTIPAGYINKTICGCGMTTVALENDENVIIAVPTKSLALNKSSQYPNERFSGKVLAVLGDTEWGDIEFYCWTNRIKKIIVTYDSINKVEHLLDSYPCRLIIDESNELLSLTKLKPKVIDYLFQVAEKYKDTVSFISATPTPLEYMPKWVSTIPQIKIEWDNTSKVVPLIYKRAYPFKSLKEELILPLKRSGTLSVNERTFSKLIIFINSINQITNIVKDCKLEKSECGIICGDNLRNDAKLSVIGGIDRYISGKLPNYLFITSSGFSGIDLYDNNAMTVVVSSTNHKWQMIDLMTDLKQAVSRQRNKNNPNYGSFIFVYNQTIFDKTEEELLTELNNIHEKISYGIDFYQDYVQKGAEKHFMKDRDFTDYTLFNENDNSYTINEQAFLADKYFIMETRNQYTKGFDIRGNFESSEKIEIPKSDIKYIDLVNFFNDRNVDGKVNWTGVEHKTDWITLIEESYKLYGQVWKDQSYAKKMVKSHGKVIDVLKTKASVRFSVGKKYSRKEVKEILQHLYDIEGIKRKAKHGDLRAIFNKVRDVKNLGERSVEIIKK